MRDQTFIVASFRLVTWNRSGAHQVRRTSASLCTIPVAFFCCFWGVSSVAMACEKRDIKNQIKAAACVSMSQNKKPARNLIKQAARAFFSHFGRCRSSRSFSMRLSCTYQRRLVFRERCISLIRRKIAVRICVPKVRHDCDCVASMEEHKVFLFLRGNGFKRNCMNVESWTDEMRTRKYERENINRSIYFYASQIVASLRNSSKVCRRDFPNILQPRPLCDLHVRNTSI